MTTARAGILRRLTPRSLAARMVVAAAIWSAVALVFAGVVLTRLYNASVERSFDARLVVYQKALAGLVAATPEGDPPDVTTLGEPRFLLPLSGWYWVVRDPISREVRAMSRSLFGDVLDLGEPAHDGTVTAEYRTGPGNEELRVVSQVVEFDGGRSLDVVVAGNADEVKADMRSFSRSVFVTLAVFAAGLLFATIVQVRVGLRPLQQIGAALADIREGRADRLAGEMPSEIAPLSVELNALIDANRAVVERAQANVGNLAHALKTPLSVIVNETRSDGGPLAAKVLEQAEIMRGRIDSDLDRARAAAQRRTIGAASEVAPSLAGLAKVLRRAYPDPGVAIDIDCPPDLRVRVARSDLEEMVGNLLDNACKFGNGRVLVRARPIATGAASRAMIEIVVEDDGPGLAPELRREALARGRRLDESVPGSGLGLAIVEELVEAYGGTITLGAAGLGGLAVAVVLPRS
ncbi:sensor histidine kinase [Methylobrevis albus]|nr:sensor histidine kinase [Methylobrevis albus]